MKAIAAATSEDEYLQAVDQLESCEAWQASEPMQQWFKSHWLAFHKVLGNLLCT